MRISAILVSTAFVLTAFSGVGSVALGVASAVPSTLADLLSARGVETIDLESELETRFGSWRTGLDETVLVMVKLEGEPVAAAQADVLPQKLTPNQKDALKQTLRARQDALKPEIERLGGTVVGQYQVAYNGLKIEIPRSRLASLATVSRVVDLSPIGAWVPAHTASVPLIGAPSVWAGTPNFRGEGIKLAIIDTGIDRKSVV